MSNSRKAAALALLLVALVAPGAHAASKIDAAKKVQEAISVMQDSLINADWTGAGDSEWGTFTISFNTTVDTANELMDTVFGEVTNVTESAGEEGAPDTSTFRDTLVQMKNDRTDTVTVYIGISDAAAIDPGFQIPHYLEQGQTVSKQNWNSFTDYDVISDVDVEGHDQIRIEVGNPKGWFPWVKVCGDSHNFYENEQWTFSCNGVDIHATRNADQPEAISWTIEIK